MADGAAPADVYQIRTIASRFREIHRADPSYSSDDLRADVKKTLIGQGTDFDETVLDEAIKGMAF